MAYLLQKQDVFFVNIYKKRQQYFVVVDKYVYCGVS